jgi:putative transposase
MLPQSTPDLEVKRKRSQLAWIHTVESTRRLYNLAATGRASIQKVTIAKRGGRWQVSFLVRHNIASDVRRPQMSPKRGRLIAVDVGVKHLAALNQSVPGLTDGFGHIANPRVLHGQLRRLRRLDRGIARCVAGSNNRRRLVERRARLHGQITKTRALHLHRITNALADGFDVVAIEDLNIAGMANRKRHLGRALADASLGEIRRQLTYKTTDRNRDLVVVGRFYPSSKTCSVCGAVKAKLPLHLRIYDCDMCGMTLDRDVNAAHNIAREADRLLEHQQHDHEEQHQHDVAGLRPETGNADPRPRKTSNAQATLAEVA